MLNSRARLLTTAVAIAFIGVVWSATAAGQRGDQRGGDPRGAEPRGDQRPGSGIVIFAEANFRGLSASFTNDAPDLRTVNMNDRVDSLRIAPGEAWEVCQDINYKLRCQVFTDDVPDLGRVGWGGLVSSLRRARDTGRGGGRDNGGRGDYGRGGYPPPPPPRPMRARIILFDTVGFGGRSMVLSGATANLRSWGNRTGSVKVYGGSWELCDGIGYRGKCQIVTDSVFDLDRMGLRDRVSSIRPVAHR